VNRIAVLGLGSWGLTLARLLHNKGFEVAGWEFDPQAARQLQECRELKGKLPGVQLPEGVQVSTDMSDIVSGTDLIVFAVPSQTMRATCETLKRTEAAQRQILVSVSKGLEQGTLKTMTEVIAEATQLKQPERLVALSGPSHAEEVSRDIPTSVVVAGCSELVTRQVQETFMTERFRIYTNDDLSGVELAAALKNVIAIAAGISDGLGFGDNAKAALIARGLSEMMRLGIRMGAKPYTFTGLAGLGDLVATCTSRHSRNRNFGELIAKGLSKEQALQRIGMVVEGLETARSILLLQERCGVEMPISVEVYRVLLQGKAPGDAVRDLMLRDAKPEMEVQLYQ